MRHKTFNELRHKGIGPGGIKCPCCTDEGKMKTKVRQRRRTRRKMKEEDAAIIYQHKVFFTEDHTPEERERLLRHALATAVLNS